MLAESFHRKGGLALGADEGGALAGGEVLDGRGIDDGLVHGNAAEDGADPPAEEGPAAVAELGGEAVGIARAEDGEAGPALQGVGAAVADGRPGGKLLGVGDSGVQGEDRADGEVGEGAVG